MRCFRLVSCAVLAWVCCVGLATPAVADCHFCDPSPCACIDAPPGILLVGTANGIADPRGQFSVHAFDAAFNPVSGSSILIDFSGCPDTRVAQAQPYPGVKS